MILARFILGFDYDSRIIAWSNHKTVILRLFWRRISRDVSGSIAAGVALAPECRFLGQNAAQLQMRSDAFREILRPKEGLRMTVLGHSADCCHGIYN